MGAFQTELTVPDNKVESRGFFKVVIPTLIWTITVAFTRGYYPQNGYPVPALLNILLILSLIALPLAWLYAWYHTNYEKKGYLAISEDEIAYEWENQKKLHFDIDKVSNLHVHYDGTASMGSHTAGTNNSISFDHEDERHEMTFRLASQEAAEEMGEVMRKWYDKGIKLAETDSNGDASYLLIYNIPKKVVTV